MKKNLLLMIMILSSLSLLGKDEVVSRSIEWQKVELQEKISKKITKAVGAIVDQRDFVVEVDLAVSIPPAPNFDDRAKYQARSNDGDFEKAAKDYIIFSKLGLEVPILGKETNKDKERLKDIWKFNEANDIFKNLDSVTVFLYLDKKLTSETVDAVKTILNNLKLPIGDLTAEVEIEQLNLTDTKPIVKAEPKKKTIEDYLNYVSKFSVMIGIILSTLLLMITAFLLFKKFKEMRENEEAREMIASASKNLDEEKKEEGGQLGGAVPGMSSEESSAEGLGLERFERFLSKSSSDASLLVKKWIKEGTEDGKLALNALVQQLDNDQLFMIFESLTIDERTKWKESLKGSLSHDEFKRANDFISTQIVEDIIVPPLFQDQELIDTLLNISPKEGARFVKDHPSYGGVLMNIINTRFIRDIMQELNTEEAEEVIKRSLDFSADETQGVFEKFKSSLQEYKTQEIQKPFVKRIIDLIPIAKPGMEKSLYKALSDSREFGAVKECAGSYFPSFLISDLEDNVLREAIQTYPMKRKVELLSTDNGDLNMRLLELFAPEGSKARDHFDIEMQGIEEDLVVQRKIRENKEVIWEEFVNHVRSVITLDKSLAVEVSDIIDAWVERLESEKPQERVAIIEETTDRENVIPLNAKEEEVPAFTAEPSDSLTDEDDRGENDDSGEQEAA